MRIGKRDAIRAEDKEDPLEIRAAFGGRVTAGMIDQHLAHHSRGDAEEVIEDMLQPNQQPMATAPDRLFPRRLGYLILQAEMTFDISGVFALVSHFEA